jgi:hypothetical protein
LEQRSWHWAVIESVREAQQQIRLARARMPTGIEIFSADKHQARLRQLFEPRVLEGPKVPNLQLTEPRNRHH